MITLLLLGVYTTTYGQNSYVNNRTTDPYIGTLYHPYEMGIGMDFKTPVHNSAVLQIKSTQKGLLIPRMTNQKMENINTDGQNQATRMLIRGNTQNADIEFYTGQKDNEQLSMIIDASSGNVGIGTNEPLNSLHIEKDYKEVDFTWPKIMLKVNDSNGNDLNAWEMGVDYSTFVFTQIDYQNNETNDILFLGDSKVGICGYLHIIGDDPDITLQFDNNSTNKLAEIRFKDDNNRIYWNKDNKNIVFDNQGNVGIGTATPDKLLEVAGDIKAQGNIEAENVWLTDELYIQNSDPWPDYVFGDNYNLMPLDSLNTFIKLNKHLPNVPTAEIIEQEGMPVKEMNAILLKKVEELTLYIIQLQKQIDELKSKN